MEAEHNALVGVADAASVMPHCAYHFDLGAAELIQIFTVKGVESMLQRISINLLQATEASGPASTSNFAQTISHQF